MHDPMVVAFEIRRPWPKRVSRLSKVRWGVQLPFVTVAGRTFLFPGLITVWHCEPGGLDSGMVCQQHERVQDAAGTWRWKFHHGWRFHVRHWRLQVHPLQRLRRRLLTRCAWCSGPSRKGAVVNVRAQWDGPRGRWWQGEPGLYHAGCSTADRAHRSCSCEAPVTEQRGYGPCALCGLYRAHGVTERTLHLHSAIKAQCRPGQFWSDDDTRRVLADAPAEA